MTTWAFVLIAIAGAAISSHTILLMCHVMSCYRAWKRANGADGFLRIAGRTVLATVAYGILSATIGVPFFVLVSLLGFSPELAGKLSLFNGLAGYAVGVTFGLPFLTIGWDYPTVAAVVLIAFFVLGLVTMLPGLGYGSKRLWGAIGLAAYAAYLSALAAYIFAQINADPDYYIACFVLVVVSFSLALGALRLYLRITSWLTRTSPQAEPSAAPATSPS